MIGDFSSEIDVGEEVCEVVALPKCHDDKERRMRVSNASVRRKDGSIIRTHKGISRGRFPDRIRRRPQSLGREIRLGDSQ